ncbi:glycosyltransferase family 25 protein [Oxalobacter vibrioformis]|uniref:Glycosyltransferase family 25 protein n=1 Tax=Oxalobacter vibrioformis TaxID=933080 RepID=A0A9E9LXN4_9BURK|nr:glycosyltransferase family 25 protein [Oxalobacter vibrioformis]WAW10592.1 glycosyltransferase family 25 protein [Oxalobacter vibrioformis]
MQCFVINLAKDTDRKQSISEELKKAGIEFAFIEAVNGAELLQNGNITDVYNETKAIRERHRKMTAGEIGCALSHLKIYRKMQDENISHALVMEDDIYIQTNHFRKLLEKVELLYDENTPTVTLFSHIKRYVSTKESQPLDETHVVHDYYRGGSAYCYVITKRAAKKMLDSLFPLYTIIDKWELHQDFINVKAVIPYCAYVKDQFPSSINAIGGRDEHIRKNKIRNLSYYLKHYMSIFSNVFRRISMDIRKQPPPQKRM